MIVNPPKILMGYDDIWSIRDPYAFYDTRVKGPFDPNIIISEGEGKNNLQIFEVLRTITVTFL